VLFGNASGLLQRIERQSPTHSPILYELPVVLGPNRVMEKLDGVTQWARVRRFETVEQDLKEWLLGWSGKWPEWRWVRERATGVPSDVEAKVRKGSDHIVRLHVVDEVRAAMVARRFLEAGQLAARYQLVTPASGARTGGDLLGVGRDGGLGTDEVGKDASRQGRVSLLSELETRLIGRVPLEFQSELNPCAQPCGPWVSRSLGRNRMYSLMPNRHNCDS
jgi:hypothetical protein